MLKETVKHFLRKSSASGLVRTLLRRGSPKDFETSAIYWEERYKSGGTSGAGSYGRLAEFKANTINAFVSNHNINSVIEFGSGDGNQLSLARYPLYIGVDVSESAIIACRERFAEDTSKKFISLADYNGDKAELALSLDVIFHLTEDDSYELYMRTLFDAAERFVIIYSSNKNESGAAKHVRHHEFTDWVKNYRRTFSLISCIQNPFPFDHRLQDRTSYSDFYIFKNNNY